jgi:hypothetical protein
MAEMTDVRLGVDVDLNNDGTVDAVVRIDTDIQFADQDVASNQLFDFHWKLIGPDRLSGEDGVDDTLIGQGAADIIRFAADGRTSMTHHVDIRVPLEELNEDATGEDEVRAEVSLDPVGPFGDSRESNKVALTIA